MPKALAILGMVVSIFTFLVFALDLGMGIPFDGASTVMDIGFIICGAVLAYLSWSTYREVA